MNTLQPLFHIPVVTFAQPTWDGWCEYAIQ
jgi:hypothetical protein